MTNVRQLTRIPGMVAILCVFMASGVLLLDILTPISIQAAALYSVVIAATLLADNPVLTRWTAVLCIALILLGGAISPDSSFVWFRALNRSLYIVTVVITASLVVMRQRDARQIRSQQQQLEQSNRELEKQAHLDALTGIANRRAFDEQLERECAHNNRSGQPISLLMIDVDHFKRFNDAAGHPAGDDCLQAVAAAIQKSLRRPVDFVARYGGEEFSVILPGTALDGARERAEEIRRAVRALNIPHPGMEAGTAVTVSIGISTKYASATPEALLHESDGALYLAKQQGRDRVVCAD